MGIDITVARLWVEPQEWYASSS